MVGQTRKTVLVCPCRILARKRRAAGVPGQGMRAEAAGRTLGLCCWGTASPRKKVSCGQHRNAWSVTSSWVTFQPYFLPLLNGQHRKDFGMECDCSVCSDLGLWWLGHSLSVTPCQRRQELDSPQGLFFIIRRQGVLEISSMPWSQAAERGLCLPREWQCCRASGSFWEVPSALQIWNRVAAG